jgi:hypothetical protein
MRGLVRSIESPQQLSFKVGLPEGASLVPAKDGSGNIEVVDEGAVIATVLAPNAHDASGTAVPVSMTVSGDTLVLLTLDAAGRVLLKADHGRLSTNLTILGSSQTHTEIVRLVREKAHEKTKR